MYLQTKEEDEQKFIRKVVSYDQEDLEKDCGSFKNEDYSLEHCNPKTRVMFRDGKCSARRKHLPSNQFIFHMQDVFTSLVESRWRITLLVFILSFLISWLFFGILWWAIAHEHGDLKGYEYYDPHKEPCITAMQDFISCFLFSLETQYSTGYGSRSPTTECPDAIILLIIQSIFGVLIQSTMAGIVFAKLARPKARGQQIMFSKKAVICLRDGCLSLLFRVGDCRKVPVMGVCLRAWFLQHRITQEGEILPYYQYPMKLNIDSGRSDAFVFWPTTVLHKIDANSPLFNISAANLSKTNFEIVIILNGTVEATGQATEARTSYLPTDIIWGHRFKQMIKYYKKRRYDFAVDFSRFEETVPVDTPMCCAHLLVERDRGSLQPPAPLKPSETSAHSSYHTL